MRIKFRILVFAFAVFSQLASANEEAAFRPVSQLFLAMSQVDHQKMKSEVVENFVLLEHGEIWKIEDLIRVVKPSDYKRTNYFSFIDSTLHSNIAWINYWNKANFDNSKNSEDVVWLESVVVIKTQGRWKLAQMHSTRLEKKSIPKDIPFVKQRTE